MDESITLDHPPRQSLMDHLTLCLPLHSTRMDYSYYGLFLYKLNGLYGPNRPNKWTSPLSYSIELNGAFPYTLTFEDLSKEVCIIFIVERWVATEQDV